jgi:hypothetical protein
MMTRTLTLSFLLCLVAFVSLPASSAPTDDWDALPGHLLEALEELAPVGPEEILDLRPLLELLEVRHDEHHRILPAVADHDRLADVLVGLRQVLDRLRRDVLAARGDDDVLLAVGDPQEAAAVDLADVAGVEPPVGVDHLRRRVGLVVVALHHVRTSREDLSVRCDRHLDAGDRLAHRADLEVVWGVDGYDRRGLRQPVAFEDHQARGVEELVDLRRERSAA